MSHPNIKTAPPTGRNAIRTADPLLQAIFQAAWRRGQTTRALCKILGVGYTTLSNWRRGVSSPDSIYLPSLVEAVGLRLVLTDEAGIFIQNVKSMLT